ncbi:MAG: group II truncated hemoglobin [Planctomycetota bacterium]
MEIPSPDSSTANAWGDADTPYLQLGGDERVRSLTDAFYDHVANDELMARIHPEDLTESREKLYEFLSGWLGGPALYIKKHGHPRLRMRHMPFPIDEAAVDAWLSCMRQAMSDVGIEDPLRSFLDGRFEHTARFMQNRG